MKKTAWYVLAVMFGAAMAVAAQRPGRADRHPLPAPEQVKIPLEVPDPPDRMVLDIGKTGEGYVGAVYNGR